MPEVRVGVREMSEGDQKVPKKKKKERERDCECVAEL